jgi:4-amino-4-deoxy-L-arabinose transferase-like glycosyltransferase
VSVLERAGPSASEITWAGIVAGTNRRVTYAVLAVILVGVFVPASIVRVVDADEGAYLIAAKLVMQGKLLYHDFSYPQMPLLPYLYGAWMKVFGISWYAGRLLSALFSVLLGLALYRQTARLTGRATLAFLTTVAYAFTGLAFAWFPLVKSFVFPTLMVFLACAILDSAIRWKYFLSGLFLGLAVDTRFYVFVVIFTLAIEVVRRERGAAIPRELGLLAAGLALALAPNLFLFVLSPDTFVFNVFGHHAIRWPGGGPVGDFPQKMSAILAMIGLDGTEGATTIQFSVLLFLNVALVVSRLRMRQPLPPSVSIAGLLIAVSLLPTPIYTQYACMPAPFMIMNAALLIADLIGDAPVGLVAGRRLKHVLVLLLGIYIAVAAGDVHRYVVGWDSPPLLKFDDWRIPTINRVSRAIDAQITADNPLVITWWPGYLIESKATILPRTENHFNLWYSVHLAPEDVGRYNYISFDELVWHIMHHTANVVALGNWVWDVKPRYRQILAQSGYVMVDKIGETEIYRWKSPAH